MDILKVFFIFITTATIISTLTGCAHTFSEGELEDIPAFESLVGSGTLYKTGPSIEDKKIEAILSLNKDYLVSGQKNCKALSLATSEGPVLNVAVCGEDRKYIICGRSIAECTIYFETSKSHNTLSLTKDKGGDDVKFLIEFHDDKMVYRIQGETCLIPYPHGCIIDGFGWRDRYTYTYVYK
jgi:hypothetical protein